jgi:signal transduction histidine kinase
LKLWQKIFLLTLALVVVVVNATSLVLLNNNHLLAIEREQHDAVSRHNYLTIELQNTIIYTQLKERSLSLNDDEVLRVAREVFNRQRGDSSTAAALYQGETPLIAVNTHAGEAERVLLTEPNYASKIVESGGSTYLLVGSTITLNDTAYHLISSLDITPTYTLFAAELDLVRIVGIISALVVAGILLLLVQGLLAPLRNLSSTTRKIAQGDLDKRALVKGNDEVAEVARNLNSMADSIEHNVTKLEDLAESRTIFIGNLAHEMKTPLTSILGFADILRIKRDVTDEDRIEYAGVIVHETKRLQGLSSKLMELLALGNLQPTLEVINLQELSAELSMTLQPIFENQGLHFTCDLKDASISADRELIKSLLYNLIDNSIKASSPDSTVTLLSTVTFESVTVAVRDQGMGIPAEQIPLLTEPFYMLDKARTRKHGGAGLGLALCAEIARAHGSSLVIESTPGEGTCVSVRFAREVTHDKQ